MGEKERTLSAPIALAVLEQSLDEGAVQQLFLRPRTHSRWLNASVDDALLREMYNLAKLAPTSGNSQPMRVVFVESREAKERLKPALAPRQRREDDDGAGDGDCGPRRDAGRLPHACGTSAGPRLRTDRGFDRAKVDAAFLPDSTWRSNFLVNLGYGDPAGLSPRSPRLAFEEACRIV